MTQPKQPRKKRRKSPKHPVETRAYAFPLIVDGAQSAKLHKALNHCHRLYNLLIRERKNNYAENKEKKRQNLEPEYLKRADQYKNIALYVKADPGIASLHSQVRQNIAVRINEGYNLFFEGLKARRPDVKPPKYKDRKRYKSFTYPQYGSAARITSGRLILSNLGGYRVHDYRKVKGRKKTVTIKFKQGRWWVVITAEQQVKDVYKASPCADNRPVAGIDTGLSALMTDSKGQVYDPPRAWYEHRRKLKIAQKSMSRKFEHRKEEAKKLGVAVKTIPYSNRLKQQIARVAKIHTKIENIRAHHHKKNAAIISSRYSRVAIEDHSVKFMIRNRRLSKLASDRAIHGQKLLLKSKLGDRLLFVPNRREGIGGNSQTCICGANVPKKLNDRLHVCTNCGLVGQRDHVAANVVELIGFGSHHLPEDGQSFVMRGESKAWSCENSLCELPKAASELPMKRKPRAVRTNHTAGGKPTAEAKTLTHFYVPIELLGEVKDWPSIRNRIQTSRKSFAVTANAA